MIAYAVYVFYDQWSFVWLPGSLRFSKMEFNNKYIISHI